MAFIIIKLPFGREITIVDLALILSDFLAVTMNIRYQFSCTISNGIELLRVNNNPLSVGSKENHIE